MERLSGLDASFLYLETVTQPLHVCSLLELDTSTMPGGYTFDRLRDALGMRIKAMPQFREKLADSRLNLDHPVWVDDNAFDLGRHLRCVGVPTPGGRAEVAEVCAQIAAVPLDRDHPLWEMWVIEGLAGTPASAGGRVAVLTKVHHAAVDGVMGADLLAQLCSTEPDAPPPDAVAGAGGAHWLQIAASGLVGFAARSWRLVNVLSLTGASLVETARRARCGRSMARPFAAPPTAFNAAVTAQRNIAYTQLELSDIKKVKDRFGVKVNDVVMALCAGVLRRWLSDRGELPAKPLVAMVPVSVRDTSGRPGHNQVSGMFSRLETHISDPGRRLQAIAQANSRAKDHSSAIGATLLQDWAQFADSTLFGTAMRLFAKTPLTHTPVHNVIVSNVAGPQVTLYFLGARLTAIYPLGPIFHGCGLNITVISLNGKLDFGIISCPQLLPDLAVLADDFTVELQELLAASPPGT
ncbi:WS/DGAT/MGAT family O-acyltransferase [Mycobacterium kansasii]|uniref:Diacylglycerol O-acyltransferase n=3 Tax=Mycobacterium kansasii TaxID=1768 RepID=A0A1V3X836_MYCKA|nr:wax ester/triacylglycerol synthase family O-acyltransferase [Mycobacterium kansasii]ETZ97937.1 acyltransferase, WS/DGAT/MGAT family protein [Mycobacterium kansasii 824]AGZ50806.1 diacylglycerol O-acyltransferase Rv1760/MT1809 [Mycobacterium kansasii ATCC 12478]ARG57400.1 wax ester/triacylglycerol synthase family O-acyltransferase [Mycobacterium kansasii]ARG62903.1 wax ester/triacylglycerol synthase family O-acyltransferase [Mycobacterium kansasii]ARG70523.1 wax ester/triacylglycerol synthas